MGEPGQVTPKALYEEMAGKAIWASQFAWTPFLYLTDKDFAAYQPFFEPDKYQPGKWRMGGLFRNLHAVPVGEGVMNVHVDFGNPNRHFWLGGLVHGVVDCPVWTALSLWRFRRLVGNPSMAEMRVMVGER